MAHSLAKRAFSERGRKNTGGSAAARLFLKRAKSKKRKAWSKTGRSLHNRRRNRDWIFLVYPMPDTGRDYNCVVMAFGFFELLRISWLVRADVNHGNYFVVGPIPSKACWAYK